MGTSDRERIMKILCIAQVEDRTNLDTQIIKQTFKPWRTVFYIDEDPEKSPDGRRIRIADNHKKLQSIVRAYKPDLVWQVEQDGDYPPDCLERLVERYQELNNKDFGYISGIQCGRHGLYHLGAWRNFTDTSFESLDYKLKGIQEVEAAGFYCLLAPTDVWLSGQATWNGEPYGPDVTLGLSINKKKYVDMDITIGHKIKSGIIRPEHKSTCNVIFNKVDDKWSYKQL